MNRCSRYLFEGSVSFIRSNGWDRRVWEEAGD